MQYDLYFRDNDSTYIVHNLETNRCWSDRCLGICIDSVDQGLGWSKDNHTLRSFKFIATISRETHPEYFI